LTKDRDTESSSVKVLIFSKDLGLMRHTDPFGFVDSLLDEKTAVSGERR